MDRDPLTPGPSRDPSLLGFETVARELDVDPLTWLSDDDEAAWRHRRPVGELRGKKPVSLFGAKHLPSSIDTRTEVPMVLTGKAVERSDVVIW